MSSTFPKLAPKGRLKYDKVRENYLLLLPEKVVVLNDSAASILTLCDGMDSVHTITKKLRSSLQLNSSQADPNGLPDFQKMEEDITNFLKEMVDQGWVVMQYERVQE